MFRIEELSHLVTTFAEVLTRYAKSEEELGDGRDLGVSHRSTRPGGDMGKEGSASRRRPCEGRQMSGRRETRAKSRRHVRVRINSDILTQSLISFTRHFIHVGDTN